MSGYTEEIEETAKVVCQECGGVLSIFDTRDWICDRCWVDTHLSPEEIDGSDGGAED